MDLHGDALSRIMGDMDDMESKKMYPSEGGATITITVAPAGGEPDGDEGLPEDHDISMCGGSCAMHKGGEISTDAEDLPGIPKMADGGQVPMPPAPAEVDDTRLPPFLRKKR